VPNAALPKPVDDVVSTLAELFRHQGRIELAELFQDANVSLDQIDYDNWNGGTYTWALRIELPIPRFASIEPRLNAVEKEIEQKLAHFDRLYPNDHLNTVSISPLSSSAAASSSRGVPSDLDVKRIWPAGLFRLFLTHVSEHKIAVAKLKRELACRGVAGFVAHEDIAPSLEWEHEIELALRSMHALAALITEDFHASPWTDQEVGWAFGRGLLVVPIRLGADPYGFAGKVQAISANLTHPVGIAKALVGALVGNPSTRGEMRRVLTLAFCEAGSFAIAIELCGLLTKMEGFTEEEKTNLRKACVDNPQVVNAFGVPESIHKVFGTLETALAKPANHEVPF
jgi:hypothetical protein